MALEGLKTKNIKFEVSNINDEITVPERVRPLTSRVDGLDKNKKATSRRVFPLKLSEIRRSTQETIHAGHGEIKWGLKETNPSTDD